MDGWTAVLNIRVNIFQDNQPSVLLYEINQNTIPSNQQQGVYSSQSQDKGEGGGRSWGVLCSVSFHQFGGGASKGALRQVSMRLAVEFKYH